MELKKESKSKATALRMRKFKLKVTVAELTGIWCLEPRDGWSHALIKTCLRCTECNWVSKEYVLNPNAPPTKGNKYGISSHLQVLCPRTHPDAQVGLIRVKKVTNEVHTEPNTTKTVMKVVVAGPYEFFATPKIDCSWVALSDTGDDREHIFRLHQDHYRKVSATGDVVEVRGISAMWL